MDHASRNGMVGRCQVGGGTTGAKAFYRLRDPPEGIPSQRQSGHASAQVTRVGGAAGTQANGLILTVGWLRDPETQGKPSWKPSSGVIRQICDTATLRHRIGWSARQCAQNAANSRHRGVPNGVEITLKTQWAVGPEFAPLKGSRQKRGVRRHRVDRQGRKELSL